MNDQNKNSSEKKIPILPMMGGFIILIALGLFLSGFGSFINAIPSPASIFDILFPWRSNVSLPQEQDIVEPYEPELSFEQKLISVVKQNMKGVVSVIQTQYVPIFETCYRESPFDDFITDPFLRQFFGSGFSVQIPEQCQIGKEKREVGGGTGFIISKDGIVVTNKHVVADEKSDYTIFTSDGNRYDAKVLARDPFQDFAILKIDAHNLPTLTLGNSDAIEIGQFVVAIGNALGEFRNTVSLGVVSGIRRNIAASGPSGFREVLDEVIQTDAAINPGNSGGPLLNLRGEVIGINTAIAQGAQNISFTIPINSIKRSIVSFQSRGHIVYPFLGVRYAIISPSLQKEKKLLVDYGAFITSQTEGGAAIVKGSAAEKAGLRDGDIILEINGQKITTDSSLAKLIQRYQPGEVVKLKVLRQTNELLLDVTLGEQSG